MMFRTNWNQGFAKPVGRVGVMSRAVEPSPDVFGLTRFARKIATDSSTSAETRSNVRRVWKFLQYGIVPGRLEVFQCQTENWIEPGAGVPDIKIERRELVSKMQLWVVVQGTAEVAMQFLLDRPLNHVPHGVKIKVKIESDVIIEAETFVIDRIAAN